MSHCLDGPALMHLAQPVARAAADDALDVLARAVHLLNAQWLLFSADEQRAVRPELYAASEPPIVTKRTNAE